MDLDKSLLIIFFFSLFLNFFVIKNYKYFFLHKTTDKDFYKPQSFHTKGIPRIGGLLVFIYFLFFIIFFPEKNFFFPQIVLLGSLFFLIGFFSDIDSKISPNKRLCLMLISAFIIIYFFDIRVKYTQFQALDILINNYKLFSVIFVCLCLVFLSNGCNFIDGFNGLLIIHIIIIFLILYYINYNNGNVFFFKYLISFVIITLISVLIYNFPYSKIFLGDGGSYFLGILTSLVIIELSNANPLISPFFFASILFYIFFEVFFSFFRKIFFNSSPLKPDKKHLHMLFFIWIFSKVKNLNKANYLTGLLINVLYFFMILPLLFNYKNMVFCKIYFFILLNLYLISYLILRGKTFKLRYIKKNR
jgi:UDP-N-acetylmuramyl pentapeptide phosphotransferase/UDP-N-acetylglucosamine-1-phosphate transferase